MGTLVAHGRPTDRDVPMRAHIGASGSARALSGARSALVATAEAPMPLALRRSGVHRRRLAEQPGSPLTRTDNNTP